MHKIGQRFLHSSRLAFSAGGGGTAGAGGQKSALAALRKKTGYTFANCKKALEMHNNDIQKV